MSLFYIFVHSPIGELKLAASDKGLVAILWKTEDPRRVRLCTPVGQRDHSLLLETERQLHEYFSGKRQSFSLPLDMRGTRFQKRRVESIAHHTVR